MSGLTEEQKTEARELTKKLTDVLGDAIESGVDSQVLITASLSSTAGLIGSCCFPPVTAVKWFADACGLEFTIVKEGA